LGADDQSSTTYTITGTDADGKAQTEDRLGPGASATVASVKYFKTVTSVVIASAAAGSTIDMGTTVGGLFSSKTIILDHYAELPASVQVDVTGTINFDVESTLQNPLTLESGVFAVSDQEDLAWINDGSFTGKTADIMAQLGIPGVRAIRVTGNSYSAGAELQVYITQPNKGR